MTPHLELALRHDFPILYRDDRVRMFEHSDGWEPLVRNLSSTLESLVAAQLVDGALNRLAHRPVAVCVKQHFGALWFEVEGRLTPQMIDAINNAENEASQTCEKCGALGELSGTGWRYVTCGRHG